ncbi:hypothetical protein Pelo_6283 [Pelomyxa schiedti]|nr:hypothetical protein Pelo_6283 [Pelomyxa schiedti]
MEPECVSRLRDNPVLLVSLCEKLSPSHCEQLFTMLCSPPTSTPKSSSHSPSPTTTSTSSFSSDQILPEGSPPPVSKEAAEAALRVLVRRGLCSCMSRILQVTLAVPSNEVITTCIRSGNYSTFEQLITRRLSCHSDEPIEPIVDSIISNGKITHLQLIMHKGVRVTAPSFLHACKEGQPSLAEILLDSGMISLPPPSPGPPPDSSCSAQDTIKHGSGPDWVPTAFVYICACPQTRHTLVLKMIQRRPDLPHQAGILYGENFLPVMVASACCKLSYLQVLLKSGAAPAQCCPPATDERSPVCLALANFMPRGNGLAPIRCKATEVLPIAKLLMQWGATIPLDFISKNLAHKEMIAVAKRLLLDSIFVTILVGMSNKRCGSNSSVQHIPLYIIRDLHTLLCQNIFPV